MRRCAIWRTRARTRSPLFGLVAWEVRPLLEFKEGLDTVRAKLAEVQAAMAGG
jgi:hypothetical protein